MQTGATGATGRGLLIYGVTGYTGRLVVERCRALGLTPILSGRDDAAVEAIAKANGLEARPAALEDSRSLDRALEGMGAVLHCAGPFSLTAPAMAAACLRQHVHYVDITGEIAVFEMMAAADNSAKKAGITLLPGAGFDVVPSDCLAAHLKRRLPGATELTLAFTAGGGISHGTAVTMAQNIGAGGAVRRGGKIERVPAAWRTREIDFGEEPSPGRAGRPRFCVTIPWGDVSTAWHSTGIPDIEVYTAVSRRTARAMRLSSYIAPLLSTSLVQGILRRAIDRRPAGPGEEQRSRTRSHLWGEARDGSGAVVRARLVAPEGYTLTAMTAVESALRLLAPDSTVPSGFMTPSKAFGADYILGFPGTLRTDLP